ncbi:Hsp70 family protein [Desulfobacterota bacterium M19]
MGKNNQINKRNDVIPQAELYSSNLKKIIGIDLGTTNSLLSFVKNGAPRIIPNERGSRTTPSVVCLKKNKVIVGEMARNQAVLNSELTVANVKLDMGTERRFTINERQYAPEEISGFILAHLREIAEDYLGREVEEAVITVPAYFDDNQRQATLRAAAMTGILVRKLLNEPTAAALTYGMSEGGNSHMLVIDLGGGTLDITLMAYEDKVFRVMGVGGSTAIGGINFDNAIIEYILTSFAADCPYDLRNDRIAYQQLVIHAEKAKIDLSSSDSTTLMIPYIAVTDDGPLHLNMEISRTDFNDLSSPILEEIKRHILETFSQAGLAPEWVDSVIMVGGASRIPAVGELVDEVLGFTCAGSSGGGPRLKKNINPDEAVARGAGILAGVLNGEIAGVEFHDITAHHLGIEDDEGNFVNVIPAASSYPVEVSRLFTTVVDNQPEVIIHIMQDRGLDGAPDLVSLGRFHLAVNHGLKKGEPNIDVTFAIDLNGVLTVSALDLDTGEGKDIMISDL